MAVSVALLAARARADPTLPSLDLSRFQPALDPGAVFYLESTETPGSGAWNLGIWSSYAYRLVTVRDSAGRVVDVPLAHQFRLDYLGSVGVGDWLALGVVLPTVFYQTGDEPPVMSNLDRLPKTSLGDLVWSAKANLLSGESGFGLAALGRVSLPTGNRASYLGEGAVGGELRLLGQLDLLAIALRATAGVRLRGAERTYMGERFGHELPWGAGLVVRPQAFGWDDEGRWEWLSELHGALAATPELGSGPQSPIWAGFGARYALGAFSVFAGTELPANSAVGVPRVRAVLGLGWAPRTHDIDHDGVEDEVDQCIDLEEDRDGFEDDDGCPEFDDEGEGASASWHAP